jgi:hypothetical protein
MTRLFVLTALSLFLGLNASHAQTSLHKQYPQIQVLTPINDQGANA